MTTETEQGGFRKNRFLNAVIHEYTIITLIIVNALVLFFYEFPDIRAQTGGILFWIDYACIIYFVVEALIKVSLWSWRGYWSDRWNRFDFTILLCSIPALLAPVVDVHAFSVFMVLRVGRLFRFIRLIRFIPNFEHLLVGIRRALRASVGIFLVLLIMNLAFAIGATILFGEIAPQYFGDPLISSYTLFKVFTVEGWYDVPEALAGGMSSTFAMLVKLYFILAVLTGGILGISLANAVFVDEMTADNTEAVENMVQDLHQEVSRFHGLIRDEQHLAWQELHAELEEMRRMIEELQNGESEK